MSGIPITLRSSTGSILRKHGTRKHSGGGAAPSPHCSRARTILEMVQPRMFATHGALMRVQPRCSCQQVTAIYSRRSSACPRHSAYSASSVMHARRTRHPYPYPYCYQRCSYHWGFRNAAHTPLNGTLLSSFIGFRPCSCQHAGRVRNYRIHTLYTGHYLQPQPQIDSHTNRETNPPTHTHTLNTCHTQKIINQKVIILTLHINITCTLIFL